MVNKKTRYFLQRSACCRNRGGDDIVLATVWPDPSSKLVWKQFWAIKKTPSSAFTLGKINNYALTLPLSVKS